MGTSFHQNEIKSLGQPGDFINGWICDLTDILSPEFSIGYIWGLSWSHSTLGNEYKL